MKVGKLSANSGSGDGGAVITFKATGVAHLHPVVMVGSTEATCRWQSTEVSFTTPPGSGKDVKITVLFCAPAILPAFRKAQTPPLLCVAREVVGNFSYNGPYVLSTEPTSLPISGIRTVGIFGGNFSIARHLNRIRLSGVQCLVVEASPTKLLIEIPAEARCGEMLTIECRKLTTAFRVRYCTPSISWLSLPGHIPTEGGITFRLHCQNISPVVEDVKVYVGGKEATVQPCEGDQIDAILPSGFGNGQLVTVSVCGKSSAVDDDISVDYSGKLNL